MTILGMGSRPLVVAVLSPQVIVEHGLVGLLERHPDRVRVVPRDEGVTPDVLVYDVLALLHGDTEDLHALVSSPVRVLAVSRDLRPELVARAVALGVDGSLTMNATEDELLRAVEAVARGGGSTPAARPGASVGLTEREVQVLTLITQGLTNQEIARTLYLSPNSIKTYVRTAYRKIGAASRSQAVAWAIRHGFPTEPGE
jgi:DNA-binding NarL/FixJ family response regulator